MNPPDFINFFKTKSGKLVLFAVVFGAGLLLFSIVREKSGTRGEMDAIITRSRTNQTDKPQVVHTVERPMQPFHPPPPKPEAPPTKTDNAQKVVVERRPNEVPPTALASLSLFADAAAGV